MDPETPTTCKLLPTITQHIYSVQRNKVVLAQQEVLMAKHSQLLADIPTSIRQLFDQLPLPQATPPATACFSSSQAPTPLSDPHLPPPQRYTGNHRACHGFLMQCSLNFELQPSSFPSDRAKMAYLITPHHSPLWQGPRLGHGGLEGQRPVLLKLLFFQE